MARESTSALTPRLTAALRERLEARRQLPFWTAARAGTLPLEGYVSHLAAWAGVWAEVESLGAAEGAALFTDDLRFSGLLKSDLAYLKPLCPGLPGEPARAVEALVRQLRTAVKAEPVMFLGALYTLLTLLRDSQALDDCGRQAYGLSFSGRAFWRYQALGAEARCRDLESRLDTLSAEGRAAERIEAAARATLSACLDFERSIAPGTNLAPLAAQRTPPGALVPPRPNQRPEGQGGMGILRGAPRGRRPR